MSYLQAEKKRGLRFGEDSDAVMRLIAINVIVFVILKFIEIVFQLTPNADIALYKSQVLDWVGLPANLSTFITRPWVLLSHMIAQYSLWQLLGNMLFLWAFGFLLQDLVGNRHIVPLYVYGGLAGAVLFIASANLLPRFAAEINNFSYLGASASVMAIAIAATVTAPDYRVFPMINGGIPLWIITLIYVIIDFAGLASSAFPHHLAHLGGAGIGYVYIKQIQKGNHPGEWMHQLYNWFINLFAPKEKPAKKTIKKEVFYNTKGQEPFSKKPNVTQQRVDGILDKISQQGYQSLTQEEKDILKKAADNET
ncbi:MAG: rhomboid family intramembrane serine protease [Lacibacter sp.]|nr:rhomboid family intramembrane serine protease [Lacibacter sp.]